VRRGGDGKCPSAAAAARAAQPGRWDAASAAREEAHAPHWRAPADADLSSAGAQALAEEAVSDAELAAMDATLQHLAGLPDLLRRARDEGIDPVGLHPSPVPGPGRAAGGRGAR